MDLDALNQLMMDNLSPVPGKRWAALAGVFLLFLFKVLYDDTHHLILYCMAVYLFHGYILFATPKDESIPDPFELDEEEKEETTSEYSTANIDNNLRPFIRNMPEYTFWLFCTKVVLVCFALSLTPLTDIPVYTPILVVYFVFMAVATLIKLYNHSRKYNYNPFWQSKYSAKE